MSLQLPTLDDRTYAELLAEARRLIPVHDPTWTDHNPTDPGIVVIELFAYLTEMLLYRTDRLTADSQRRFLKLLEGPDWQPGADLSADIRAAVSRARACDRAVTAADFERLATEDFNVWLKDMQQIEHQAVIAGASAEALCDRVAENNPLKAWWQISQLSSDPANLPSSILPIARARCLPSRNLDRGAAWEDRDAPGHVSLIVLPASSSAGSHATVSQPSERQKKALWGFLDPRRILTTRHHVVGPRCAPISAEIVVAADTGAVPEAVGERVISQLRQSFDPNPREAGWSFGRGVYVSEFYEQLERVTGVDYITDLMLASECRSEDVACSAAPQLWHESGELIGLQLMAHQLPMARAGMKVILPTTALPAPNIDVFVVIAPQDRFVRVELLCTLTQAAMDDPIRLRHVRSTARSFFHPLHGAHSAYVGAVRQLALAELRQSLMDMEDVTEVRFAVPAAPARLDVNLQLQMNAGEIIDLHPKFELVEGRN